MSSLIVAVSVIALFGSASVAVDLGNLWSSRRNVIVATDAAALAAASDYAVGRNGCALVPGFVAANDGDASLLDCGATTTSPVSGYVTVAAETPVDFAFAGIIGASDRTVGSSTTAGWGIPGGVGGLRPFGLCQDDPAFRAWVANPQGVSGPAAIPYTNQPTDCGGAPGNWGIIDLDNANPVANSDTKYWIEFGYGDYVAPGNIGGDPGAFSNTLDTALAAVRGKRFPIPVFDRVTVQGGTGGGTNARFHVVGFVAIELLDWTTTGPETKRSLEVRFVELVVPGTCCVPAGPDFGLRSVHICETDPDFDPSHCSS